MTYALAAVLLILALWIYRVHRLVEDQAAEFDSVGEQAADAWLVAMRAWSDVHDFK